MQITCKRCNHTWDYKGSADRISCSRCRTSITVHKEPAAAEPQQQQQSKEEGYWMSFDVLPILYERRFYLEKAAGNPGIQLKKDSKPGFFCI